MGDKSELGSKRQSEFIRILVDDLIAAQALKDADDSQSNRRNLIRTLFAAIEGMVRSYRARSIDVARSCEILTVEEELAFSEVSYSVTPQGKIVEQARFVPTLTMFRLTTKLAERLNPSLSVQFGEAGWESLRLAVEIRNRITHPKTTVDLMIDSADLATCRAGFDWLFETVVLASESANQAFREHVDGLREVLEALKNGDPDMWALYRELLANQDG